jgi:hypothetical protein
MEYPENPCDGSNGISPKMILATIVKFIKEFADFMVNADFNYAELNFQ